MIEAYALKSETCIGKGRAEKFEAIPLIRRA